MPCYCLIYCYHYNPIWMYFILRPYQSLLSIPLSFLSGTMMVLALDKPLVKIVKWSYSKNLCSDTSIHATSFTTCHCRFNFVLFFLLSPQAIFKDPFRGGNNILVSSVILERCFMHVDWNANIMKLIQLFCFTKVICDAYTPQGEPIPTNKRHKAAEIFSNPKVEAEIPWYVFYSLPF